MSVNRMAIVLALLSLVVSQPAVSASGDPMPLATIAALEVPRYMGRWYEIAKYPNWFQKKCMGDTSAAYNLKPEGTVEVINRCRLENGEWNEAVGLARQIGGPTSPKLEVRFAPAWLSFIPAVWGDYWVIDLDPAYQLVAVSEPRREYLWVLSRNPQVSKEAYEALLERLRGLGFDPGKLETTIQRRDLSP
jgi:apolipoprotein D and lipocalin family protein